MNIKRIFRCACSIVCGGLMLVGAILFPDDLPRSVASAGLMLVVFSPLTLIDFGESSKVRDEDSNSI